MVSPLAFNIRILLPLDLMVIPLGWIFRLDGFTFGWFYVDTFGIQCLQEGEFAYGVGEMLEFVVVDVEHLEVRQLLKFLRQRRQLVVM